MKIKVTMSRNAFTLSRLFAGTVPILMGAVLLLIATFGDMPPFDTFLYVLCGVWLVIVGAGIMRNKL